MSINRSGASNQVVAQLVSTMFQAVTNGMPPTTPVGREQVAFAPIVWTQSQEALKVQLAMDHIHEQMTNFAPDLWESFAMTDVHSKTSFLTCNLTPSLRLRGTTDIVITPVGAGPDTLTLALNALVVLEIKPEGNLPSYFSQVILAMLGARQLSNKPIMAIVTDLSTSAYAIRIRVNEHNTLNIERVLLNLTQMAWLLVEFLRPPLADMGVSILNGTATNNPDELGGRLFIQRFRPGFADAQDQLAMYFDLMDDPELGVDHRRQATENLFRSIGYEAALMRAIEEGEQERAAEREVW